MTIGDIERGEDAEWLDGDDEALERTLEKLLARRRRVADLIRDCVRGRVNPFPNWKP